MIQMSGLPRGLSDGTGLPCVRRTALLPVKGKAERVKRPENMPLGDEHHRKVAPSKTMAPGHPEGQGTP